MSRAPRRLAAVFAAAAIGLVVAAVAIELRGAARATPLGHAAADGGGHAARPALGTATARVRTATATTTAMALGPPPAEQVPASRVAADYARDACACADRACLDAVNRGYNRRLGLVVDDGAAASRADTRRAVACINRLLSASP